ncbi:DASH family cryptochrome [Undibacterium sp.]|uniref:DASH family cryptochrome n=1 Tax=Undibacterium sp. TaxID=1914977 RepID=UPI002731269F|nr:DASH family cryptochrome [Undibacterium sp.]MDP1978310.1 DASH family cryptochrome [Undibacterium sp.]
MSHSSNVITAQAQETSTSNTPGIVIYWFRNDLRLADNQALIRACQHAENLVFVYCLPSATLQAQRWNLPHPGLHRQRFVESALADLSQQLHAMGSQLLEVSMSAVEFLPLLARELGSKVVYCEEIAAPYEQDDIYALRAAGLTVHTHWQSSLLDPTDLPFGADALPDVFTQFRTLIEAKGVQPPAPLPAPHSLPALPDNFGQIARKWAIDSHAAPVKPSAEAALLNDDRSSFPYFLSAFSGGSTTACAHVEIYLKRKLPHTYKQTRNQLSGLDYSTKFSPWLASGAISARQIFSALKRFEAELGANDGSYWIWFELLWRDYFRLLHLKYGRQLYSAKGLTDLPMPPHDAEKFNDWCLARTGNAFIDAAMAELAATGYLSNRMRQVVASYLIHELACDWRAGAAWFEAQLIDYDVYSNQGNWLYIAGRGTDPRNGRRFNIPKQVHDHDRDGTYRRLWGKLESDASNQ